MSDKNKSTTDTAEDSDRSPQVGALLRASRERVGEDLREVSDDLCIRFLYLEAIEECRYDDLPGDTYAIGFIRSYAEHLGLDGEEVIRRYRMERASNKRVSDLSFPTPVQESGVPKGAIVLVGVVLAVLVYGGWYATTTDDTILSDLISPVPERLQHLVEDKDKPSDAAPQKLNPSVVETESTPSSPGVNTETQEALQANTAEAIAEATEAARDSIEDTAAAATDAVTETAEATVATTTDAVGEAATATEETAQEASETVTDAAADVAETVTTAVTETASEVATSDTLTSETASDATETAASDVVNAADTVVESEAAPESETPQVVDQTQAAVVPPPTSEAAQTDTSTESDATPTTTSAATSEAGPATTDVVETTEPTVEETPTPTTPVVEEVSAEDLNAQSLQGTAADAASSTSVETSAPVETASVTPAETATSSSGIVIRAQDNSWVQVTDPANGEILYTGLMSPGDTFDVPARSGLLLDTGNAGAIDIIVNGNSVPKLGDEGTVRKGVALDGARLIAGTATN